MLFLKPPEPANPDCEFCTLLRNRILEIGPTIGLTEIRESEIIFAYIPEDVDERDGFGSLAFMDVNSELWDHKLLVVCVARNSYSEIYELHMTFKILSREELARSSLQPYNSLYTPWIDWSTLQKFPFKIQLCDDDSLSKYRQNKYVSETSESLQPRSLPAGFRCIDVLEKCIVRLPDNNQTSYVALSYVWGLTNVDDLRLCIENLSELERLGELTKYQLPNTIVDAMTVCSKLQERYLWVDRLCIIQDGPDLKEQLEAMGSIYKGSTYTIAASDAMGAHSELPGVSQPRTWKQKAIISNGIEFRTCAPSLDRYLEKTEWSRRGWTFQEQAMSNKMLYFTRYGLFYTCQSLRASISEFPAPSRRENWQAWRSYLHPNLRRAQFIQAVNNFSRRLLTHHTDYLNAFSGFIYSLYGADTLFGLPKMEFDSSILWKTDFVKKSGTKNIESPTWSWITAYNIDIPYDTEIPSVALWFEVPFPGGEPEVLKPSPHNDGKFNHQTIAALAIHAGLVLGKGPIEMQPSLTSLETRWPHYGDYWKEIYTAYELNQSSVILPAHKNAASNPERILVYAQVAKFSLHNVNQAPSSDHDYGIEVTIRDDQNFPVGVINIDARWFDSYIASQTHLVEFVALSVEKNSMFHRNLMQSQEEPEALRRFIDCPCTTDQRSENPEIFHVDLCPFNSYFDSLETRSMWAEMVFSFLETRLFGTKVTINDLEKRLRDGISYDALNSGPEFQTYAVVNVMLIERDENEPLVARRVGVGQIYMRKWEKGNPVFETVVLA